jgi:ankyrin repeat protein
MLSIERHRFEMAKLLVELGANLEAVNLDQQTPLMVAAAYAEAPFIKLLLDHGVDPNKPNKDVYAIQQTAVTGNIDAARALLDAKVDVNARSAKGWTALHIGVVKDHADYVKFLLSRGADKTLKLDDGRTALDLATKKDLRPIIELLK